MGTEKEWVQAYHHSVSLPAPPAGAGNRESSANMVAGHPAAGDGEGSGSAAADGKSGCA